MLRDREDGFTLIELMVVVLIIGILIAIAIPTFLGVRARAQDRAAQSSLRIAVTNASTIYTDNATYLDATATFVCNGVNVYAGRLKCSEPNLTFAASNASSTEASIVSVKAINGSELVVAALSASETCWFVKQSTGTDPGAHWAKKDSDSSGTNCSADYASPGGGGAGVVWTGNTPGGATIVP